MKIGLQLWSVQDACKEDFTGTLKKVKEMGYDGVEFAGYYDVPAEELKALLSELDLTAVASHIGYEKLRDDYEATVAYEKVIGNRRIVIPWMNFETPTEWQTFFKEAQALQEKLAAEDMELYYHNHAHEFTELADYDAVKDFVKEVPAIKLEVDLYWVSYAKLDVEKWIADVKENVGLFHIKDMQEEPIESTEVGSGILPIKEYIELAKGLALPWVIVEQEAFQKYGSMEAVAIGYKQLKAIVEEVE